MLGDTTIRNTKATTGPIKLTDGNGLYIEVRPNGSKLWRYRYKIDGKENLFAMGGYCQPPLGESEEEAKERRSGRRFTLAEARESANAAGDWSSKASTPRTNKERKPCAGLLSRQVRSKRWPKRG